MIDINRMTVLIVDDMESMCKAVRGMLMVLKYGNEFHYANNGLDALSVMGKKKIDLVISDWNMPVMNGVEMVSRMKEDRKLRDIPIVMVTAEANMEIVAEAAESEIDAYILKPVNVEALGGKIRQVVDKANDPPPMLLHLKRARLLEEKGALDDAINEALLAVKADLNSSKPVHELGYFYYKKNDLENAEQWFRKAADMNHLDVFAFHYLGDIYIKQNRIDEAILFFDKAMKISPRHVSRAVDFGKLLLDKKAEKKAVAVFEKAISLSESPNDLREELIGLCKRHHVTDYAIKLMRDIIKTDSRRNDIRIELGLTYERTRDHAKAIATFIEAEAIDNDNITIKLHLAKAYLQAKQPLRAERSLRQILVLEPNNRDAKDLLKQCI